MVDLQGDCTFRQGIGESVAPQIAHEATPGTFPVAQKKGCHRDNLARFGAFLFNVERVGAERVDLLSPGPVPKDPAVALGGTVWVRGVQKRV